VTRTGECATSRVNCCEIRGRRGAVAARTEPGTADVGGAGRVVACIGMCGCRRGAVGVCVAAGATGECVLVRPARLDDVGDRHRVVVALEAVVGTGTGEA